MMAMRDLASLDLRLLRYFVAVAEELNVSRAAKRLAISQPPLTRQIQALEQMVGAPLFTRSTRGMELTEPGRVLLGEARNLLAMTRQAMDRTRSVAAGQVGSLQLAGFGSPMLGAVPLFLARFRARQSRVELVLQTLNRPEQVAALRQGRISAAFTWRGNDAPDVETELVVRENLLAVLDARHPLARRRKVALRELADLPLVVQGSGPRPNFTDTLLAMCAQAGFQPEIAQQVGDSLTAVALVAGGFGTALVPSSASHLRLPGVAYVPLADSARGIADLVCVYRKGDRSPVLRIFLEELRMFRRELRVAGPWDPGARGVVTSGPTRRPE